MLEFLVWRGSCVSEFYLVSGSYVRKGFVKKGFPYQRKHSMFLIFFFQSCAKFCRLKINFSFFLFITKICNQEKFYHCCIRIHLDDLQCQFTCFTFIRKALHAYVFTLLSVFFHSRSTLNF